jgi:hypothetical protein
MLVVCLTERDYLAPWWGRQATERFHKVDTIVLFAKKEEFFF